MTEAKLQRRHPTRSSSHRYHEGAGMSDTPRCDRCVSWDHENKHFSPQAGMADVRKCLRAAMFWDATTWNEDYERVARPEHRDDQMFVQDGSDYSAMLLTRAAFSCASFQAVTP